MPTSLKRFNRMLGRLSKRLLPYLGGLVLLGLLLRQIHPQDVLGLLWRADPWWLLVGCGWYSLTNVLRAYRFGTLLRMPGFAPPLRMVPEMFTLSFLNNVLPARAGELSFPYFMYQRQGVPVAESATALVMSRLFDFMAVACLYLLFALLELENLPGNSARVVGIVGVVLTVLMLGLALAPWLGDAMLHLLRWLLARSLVRRVLPERTQAPILRTGGQAVETLARLRSPAAYAWTCAWSLAIWLTTFAWFGSFLRAVGLPQRYPHVVVGATFASLAKAIPFITVGGFGAHEAGWTVGFSLTGMARADAIASGFAINILTLLISVLFGGVALLLIGLPVRRTRRGSALEAEK